MSALSDFRDRLLNSFSGDSPTQSGETMMRGAFVANICELLARADVTPDLLPCSWEGVATGNRKAAIDAGAFTQLDGIATFILCVVQGGSTSIPILATPDLNKLTRMLMAFVEEVAAGGLADRLPADSAVTDFRALVTANRASITKLRLLIVTDSQLSDRAKALPSDALAGLPCEFQIWDIQRLFELSSNGDDPIEINLEADFGGALPCLRTESAGASYQSFLCVLPASMLAELYGRFGARLLETNVRGFLSDSGKVNRGIRATIQNKPEMFFAYNNGLTATASHVELNAKQTAIVSLKELQIVNGGQTTASLFWAKKKYRADLSKVSVQMKLSVISETNAEHFDEFVSNVARFANSQNKVSDSDLFANHPFHREMDKLARRVGASKSGGGTRQTYWFYERARKHYANERKALSAAELRKFDQKFPKEQLIDKTDFAKYWSCWEQLPHFVSQGAQKNFKKFAETIEATYASTPEECNAVFFKRIVGVAIIYRALEAAITREPWYDGYRLNILAYTLAMTFHLAEDNGKRINLVTIADQAVPELVIRELLDLAKKVYNLAKSAEERSSRAQWGNLGQWFKESRCWDYVKNQRLPIPESLQPLLMTAHSYHTQTRDGVTIHKENKGITTQIDAQKLREAGYWQRLQDWNAVDPVLTTSEVQALATVQNLAKSVPVTERLAKTLMEAKARAENNGFSD